MLSKYIVAKSTSVYHAIIKSQLIDLSIDAFIFNMSKHVKTTNIKIMFFASHFSNVNISVTIKHSNLRFSVPILNIIREGTVSQIFFMYVLVPILCTVEIYSTALLYP